MKRSLGLVVIVGMALCSGGVWAQSISLEVVPASQMVVIGTPVEVMIKISGLGDLIAPSLSTFDLDISVDPTILSCTSATFGDPILGDQLDLLGLGSLTAITPGADFISLFELSLDSPDDLNTLQAAAFILATITCDTLALGDSPLTIAVNALGDALGEPLTATLSAGSVEVVSPPEVTLVVTNTHDSGPGSLRQAILDANASASSSQTIIFNIPTIDPGFIGGVFTIRPTSPLPIIQDDTTLDGTTQAAFTGDSNPLGPEVVINGSLAGGGSGVEMSGDHTIVKGLVVNGFSTGFAVTRTFNPASSQNQILNNYIGTDPTGTIAVPNQNDGILIGGFASPTSQARDNVIEGNLIAGNGRFGIVLCDAADTRIVGNRIGTDRVGTGDLGNGDDGIFLACAGAPRTLIEQNTIAFNGGDGVHDDPDYRFAVAFTPDGHQGNAIRRNAIFANDGLGINLNPPPFGTEDGVTANDSCDADEGANRLQNFPVLTLVQSNGTSMTVQGTLDSTPNQPFTIELFSNAAADPTGFGEGQTFLGTAAVTTDSTCQASFAAVVPFRLPVGAAVTATATDAAGNTSEFSEALTPTSSTDLATILSNSGFEAGLAQWTATKKNKNYRFEAPVVNPVIIPKGKTSPIEAPAGNNFIGILNPQDADINGRLVHAAVAQFFPAGTVFEVTVWANRGRLQGARGPAFESQPSEVSVQFFGWGAGSTPVVNPNTDNWSRTTSVNILYSFTNWGANGKWASQTFEFVTPKDLFYVSLALTGKNHIKATYAAFDID